MPSPVADLRIAAELLEQSGDDRAARVVRGIRRYVVEARHGLTLDRALDLAPAQGEQPWWRSEVLADRNAQLREIAATFLSHMEIGSQAKAITTAANRLSMAVCRDRAGTLKGKLASVIDTTGLKIPGKRRLETILAEGGPKSCNSQPVPISSMGAEVHGNGHSGHEANHDD